jgi:hypothetical protein
VNSTIAPQEPNEAMMKVLLDEGPFFYRPHGERSYQILERVGHEEDSLLLHGIVNRYEAAREEVQERTAKWRYKRLLLAMT